MKQVYKEQTHIRLGSLPGDIQAFLLIVNQMTCFLEVLRTLNT